MIQKKNILILLTILVVVSCKVDPKIIEPLPVNNLDQVVPEGWPEPNYKFENNSISEDKFILGRFLFYEPMLSKDNSISCGSCHQNFAAFAHSTHKFSHGVPDSLGGEQEGIRNSPGIFNLAWHPYFMHDGGSNHIENQPLGPISNPIEMNEKIGNVIDKLNSSEKYRTLFKNAYGDDKATSERMLKAIAQFMGLLYSYNSKYDQYKRKENNVQLTEQELSGYSLFVSKKCNDCHTEPLFSDFKFRNNGLAVDPLLNDKGRAAITGTLEAPEDWYKFKTPSLRNVALTKPYMHDGRYQTLEECLDHYTGKVTNLTNLDPLLQNNGLQITAQEKQDIIAFLNTLTDYKFVNDKRFADPNFK